MTDASKTIFGVISQRAPAELQVFSFLIGKWKGIGKTRIEDGSFAEYPVQWIGRYVLDGTAIADEVHAPAPDGSPYLGITLRQFDPARRGWIIEFLNVTGSFLRKQVNADAGAVAVDGPVVIVSSSSPGIEIHEHYTSSGPDAFKYSLDVSSDGGKTWNQGVIEMTLERQE